MNHGDTEDTEKNKHDNKHQLTRIVMSHVTSTVLCSSLQFSVLSVSPWLLPCWFYTLCVFFASSYAERAARTASRSDTSGTPTSHHAPPSSVV
jgi:hypothetical protein